MITQKPLEKKGYAHYRQLWDDITLQFRKYFNEILIIGGLLILALILRLWGTGFGLPYEYHIDENQYVRQAATMGTRGLNPADWFNPPFFKYILLSEYGALYGVGRLLGWFASTSDFGAKLTVDPTWLYLLGRWTSALMGSITVIIIYWTGKKAYNRMTGILGALLTAIAFLPVRESHFAVNDAAATLWISLAILSSIGILKNGTWRWYILGGISLGLGFATKYHALAGIIPLVIAHFLTHFDSNRKSPIIKLIGSFAIMILTAVIVSPYFILAAGKVWRNASSLFSAGQVGFEGWQIDPAGGFIFYIKTLLWGLGWALTLVSIISTIIILFRHRLIDLVLISFPLVFYIYMGFQKMFFGRFILPAIPPLILVTSALIIQTLSRFSQTNFIRKYGLVCIALVLGAQPLINSIRFDFLLSQTDTRTIAKSWIEQNIPDGSKIAMDFAYLCPSLSTKEKPVALSKNTYQVWYPDFTMGKGLPDHALGWYQNQGYRYLVACSFIYDLSVEDNQQEQERQAFYATLSSNLTPIKEFSPNNQGAEPPFIFDEIYGPAISLWERDRPGPTIKIYEFTK